MADSQQVHGGGSTRAGSQDDPQRGQAGGRTGGQPTGQRGGQAPHVEPDHESHGHSVASWTSVGIIMIGALVMCIAVVIGSVWLFVVGAVIVLAGGISAKVLSAMGFGVSGRPGH